MVSTNKKGWAYAMHYIMQSTVNTLTYIFVYFNCNILKFSLAMQNLVTIKEPKSRETIIENNAATFTSKKNLLLWFNTS